MKLHRILGWRVGVVLVGLIGVTGCPEPDDTPDGGTEEPRMVQCGALSVVTQGSPALVHVWPEGDTYGVNAFYLWEVDVSGPPEAPVFRFQEPAAEVTSEVPAKNWQIPVTRWSAIRLGLDGYDPYHFGAQEPFILGYLPYTPGSSWQSKTGATNDGTCPQSDSIIGGLHRCMGNKQLDPQAPTGLASGRGWLIRMMMIIPLGKDEAGQNLNRVQSCYQRVFIQP
ncbi:MAG: hypothetical protein JXB05_05800 [Myxococcaceae bacterium]|nr:hypothetical protein [Myxococcaceae bacterium]